MGKNKLCKETRCSVGKVYLKIVHRCIIFYVQNTKWYVFANNYDVQLLGPGT